ncbi:MAG TPA: DUF3806 domain-containing protein [Thermoanaerobaculia bacterium]|nr:DUF3806 domain-containing protein [Thermoanaerobaculia bacterium]
MTERPAAAARPEATASTKLGTAAATAGSAGRRALVERWVREARATLSQAGLGAGVEARWGELELLAAVDQALADLAAIPPPSDRLIRATAIALGEVLVRELTLDWVADGSAENLEPALRFAESEVTLYPIRMVRAHLAGARRDRTPVRLERLVSSTAAYVDHLVRYFPSRLGLERRGRGARRD